MKKIDIFVVHHDSLTLKTLCWCGGMVDPVGELLNEGPGRTVVCEFKRLFFAAVCPDE